MIPVSAAECASGAFTPTECLTAHESGEVSLDEATEIIENVRALRAAGEKRRVAELLVFHFRGRRG